MKRILILNLVPNTVGDSIIMLPLFSILKKHFPRSIIVATADSTTKDLWQDNKEIDEIIEIKELNEIGKPELSKIQKGLIYLKLTLRLIKKLKNYKFDMCFIAYPNFFLMPLIPWLAGIKKRIGYTYKGGFLSFLLTDKIESKILFDGYYDRHIMEAFLDLLRAANIPFSSKDKTYRKTVREEDINIVKNKLNTLGIKLSNKKIISIHTLSKSELKNWPKEKFKEFLFELLKKYDLFILLLGSKKEREYNEEIRLINKNKIYNLCGKFSLRETGAILKISDLFIGNDSGLAHYASSVGTPTISLFGSTNPNQARPLGQGKSIVIFKNKLENTHNYIRNGSREADLEAMKTIKVKDVLEKAEKFLK